MDKQEYLMKIVKKAENELKKKAYPRVHCRFMDIERLKFEWFESWEADGTYDKEEKRISLNIRFCDENRTRIPRRAVEVMKHELIHHYCYYWLDQYEYEVDYSNYLHWCGDGSPVFNALLMWFNVPYYGSKSYRRFVKTDFAQEIMECSNFNKVMVKVFKYTSEFESSFRNMDSNCIFTIDHKDNIAYSKLINFSFGNEKSVGISEGYRLNNSLDKFEEYKHKGIVTGLILGADVTLKQLQEHMERELMKFESDVLYSLTNGYTNFDSI